MLCWIQSRGSKVPCPARVQRSNQGDKNTRTDHKAGLWLPVGAESSARVMLRRPEEGRRGVVGSRCLPQRRGVCSASSRIRASLARGDGRGSHLQGVHLERNQYPAELRFSPTLKVMWQSGVAVVWQTLLTGPGEAQGEDLGGRRRRPLNWKQASWGGFEKEGEGLVSWMGTRGG